MREGIMLRCCLLHKLYNYTMLYKTVETIQQYFAGWKMNASKEIFVKLFRALQRQETHSTQSAIRCKYDGIAIGRKGQ